MTTTIYISDSATHGTTITPVKTSQPPKYHSYDLCPYIADKDTLEKHVDDLLRTPLEPCSGCFDAEEYDRLTPPFIYECPECGTVKEHDHSEPLMFCPNLDCLLDDVEMIPQH